MTMNSRRVLAVGLRTLTVAAFALALALPCSARSPVEYVKVCSLYGAGFNYLPGTDVCVNPATNQAKTETAGGTWQWRLPSNPVTWAQTPGASCDGGSVVKLGTFTGSDLTLNAWSRYQTDLLPLKLKRGEYIAKVLYEGGFTNTNDNTDGQGNFCMYYSWQDPNTGTQYSPLGCMNTAPRASLPGTLGFVPYQPAPPAVGSIVSLVGANGNAWNPNPDSSIGGSLSVSLCVGHSDQGHGDSASHK